MDYHIPPFGKILHLDYCLFQKVRYLCGCMKYWHAYTRGLEKGLIFRSREDFVYGMNGVPVCALMCGVDVLSFTLMTNHVHFVVTGREDSCLGFMRNYRRRLSRLADMGGNSAVGMKEIPDKEIFMRTVAYVLRNSLSSEPEVLPLFYEWGSGSCYFRKDSLLLPTEYRRGQSVQPIMSTVKRWRRFWLPGPADAISVTEYEDGDVSFRRRSGDGTLRGRRIAWLRKGDMPSGIRHIGYWESGCGAEVPPGRIS